MSNSVKALLAVVVLATVLAVGFIVYTWPHWWYRVGTAEASRPLGSVYQVTIYKSTNGDLLFVIMEDSLIDEYILERETHRIGIPSGGQLHIFPFIVYANEAPVSVVWADDKIKVETDMNIVLDDKKVEFTTFHGLRVKADTSNL